MTLTALIVVTLVRFYNKPAFTVSEIPLPAGKEVFVSDLNNRREICGIVTGGGQQPPMAREGGRPSPPQTQPSPYDAVFRAGVGEKPKTRVFEGGFNTFCHTIAEDG